MRPQKWQRAIRQIAGWRPAALARVDSPGLYSARVTTREGRLEAAVVFGFTEGEGWWGAARGAHCLGEGRGGTGLAEPPGADGPGPERGIGFEERVGASDRRARGVSPWSHHRATVPESLEDLRGLALQQPPIRETSRQPIPPPIGGYDRFNVDLVDQESPEGLTGLGGVSAQETHHVLNPLSQVALEPCRVERRHGRQFPKTLQFLGERLLASLLLA